MVLFFTDLRKDARPGAVDLVASDILRPIKVLGFNCWGALVENAERIPEPSSRYRLAGSGYVRRVFYDTRCRPSALADLARQSRYPGTSNWSAQATNLGSDFS
jgi:hypothetical protein